MTTWTDWLLTCLLAVGVWALHKALNWMDGR